LNKDILNTANQDFINKNLNTNIATLLLKKLKFDAVDTKLIVAQIEAKNKCENKLPTWFNTAQIYYPNKLNIEQTSSEITAQYKLEIVNGTSIIDLTGGFGVDCYYFAKTFKNVTHCEIDTKLSQIATHNYNQLGVNNITIKNINGLDEIKSNNDNYDWIYVDPSRRHDIKGKVFYLNDCLPNIPEALDILFNRSKNILIKASPMLDISVGISELKHVKTIHVVALNNEVKELLFQLELEYNGVISIKTVNIKKDSKDSFDFYLDEEQQSIPSYGDLKNYLYEPNAAIMKAGAFKSISSLLKLNKLHQHSHLYTSEELIDFPGRGFIIINCIAYNKKVIKKLLGFKKANVSTRNFPESVHQIKKIFNIKDGGEQYVFFTTNMHGEKIVIITTKIKKGLPLSK